MMKKSKVDVLTQDGLDKLNQELEERKVVKRKDIADKLEKATEQGDLSENSAYKSALEEKELNETRIEELEKTLANARVVKDTSPATVVGLGDKVTLRLLPHGITLQYTLVGKSETDPSQNMISVDSPVGRAIHGKQVNEEVVVQLPLKKVKYKIVKIN